MAKLTKRVVEAAEIRAADYFLWCDELPGFGVRIYPSGKRGYLVQYRADGRTRRVKIALHGVLTVDEARTEAIGHLAAVAKGGDPAEDRATRRQGVTMRELCDHYWLAIDKGLILGKGGSPKKASTVASDRGRVARHILPLLGARKVFEMSRADVTRFMRDVAAGKTAKIEKTAKLRGKAVVEGGRGTEARTIGLLGGILSFAVSEGVIASNPVHGVKRPADQRRTARLTPETYARLGLRGGRRPALSRDKHRLPERLRRVVILRAASRSYRDGSSDQGTECRSHDGPRTRSHAAGQRRHGSQPRRSLADRAERSGGDHGALCECACRHDDYGGAVG